MSRQPPRGARKAPVPPATRDTQLDLAEAEARYQRERYDLYRAKTYGPKPTSQPRLRALQRASELADDRLRAVKAKRPAPRERA